MLTAVAKVSDVSGAGIGLSLESNSCVQACELPSSESCTPS